jgi:hypothetical protein
MKKCLSLGIIQIIKKTCHLSQLGKIPRNIFKLIFSIVDSHHYVGSPTSIHITSGATLKETHTPGQFSEVKGVS